jgi:hypothetical protein
MKVKPKVYSNALISYHFQFDTAIKANHEVILSTTF